MRSRQLTNALNYARKRITTAEGYTKEINHFLFETAKQYHLTKQEYHDMVDSVRAYINKYREKGADFYSLDFQNAYKSAEYQVRKAGYTFESIDRAVEMVAWKYPVTIGEIYEIQKRLEAAAFRRNNGLIFYD